MNESPTQWNDNSNWNDNSEWAEFLISRGSWKGNPNNPVPNFIQQPNTLNEKKVVTNRAEQTRRDTDTQKNPTIRLIDVDTAILKQLEKFQLNVIDDGKNIRVPVYYSSPEKWKSIQKDGFMRDYNGKIILPAIVLQRTTSDKDQSLIMFNRYLKYPVIKLYSEKNRYTPFNLLVGKNAPINEVYEVVMPDHMIFTYHFIIWTEYVEQMNKLVERINFETDDYWGDLKGFRFRTNIESFSHVIELQSDQDRMVKTEFDLVVRGYLLPDSQYGLDGSKSTTAKTITPKKVIISSEIVSSDFNMDTLDVNREKWRNQKYPNLPADQKIEEPPIVYSDDVTLDIPKETIDILKSISGGYTGNISAVNNSLNIVAPPTSINSPGSNGDVAYDSQYFYVYSNNYWRRFSISLFS